MRVLRAVRLIGSIMLGHFICGVAVAADQLPSNSHANPYGGGWQCNKGYRKSGAQCVAVQLPANAQLNVFGNDWECQKGYRKSDAQCVPMTADELRAQAERERAILLELQRRRAQGVSGEDCETEYKTGAEVCVSVTDASLDCTEDFSRNTYQGCDVELSYEVSTNYSGGSYLDADIECEVEIEYTGRNMILRQTDSDSDSDSHSLYANGDESGSMTFDFSFGYPTEVTQARVESASCDVTDVNLW